MAGEAGRWGWWNCEATTSTGQFLVGSLFPHSANWAGIACALETATAAVHPHMPPMPHLNLFELDEETESRCARTLNSWRKEAEPASVCVWPLEDGRVELSTLLGRLPGIGMTHSSVAARVTGQTLHVGRVTGRQPLGSGPLLDDRLVSPLILGFTNSEPGRVVVPYLEWDR